MMGPCATTVPFTGISPGFVLNASARKSLVSGTLITRAPGPAIDRPLGRSQKHIKLGYARVGVLYFHLQSNQVLTLGCVMAVPPGPTIAVPPLPAVAIPFGPGVSTDPTVNNPVAPVVNAHRIYGNAGEHFPNVSRIFRCLTLSYNRMRVT